MEIDLTNPQVLPLMKALSSKTRSNILHIISTQNLCVQQIAKRIKQTEANTSSQIKILEKVGIIQANYEAGKHGVRKISQIKVKKITIRI